MGATTKGFRISSACAGSQNLCEMITIYLDLYLYAPLTTRVTN